MGKVLAEGEAWVWDIEQSGAARVHCGAWELVGGGAAALGGVRSSLQGHTKEAQMFEKHLD